MRAQNAIFMTLVEEQNTRTLYENENITENAALFVYI